MSKEDIGNIHRVLAAMFGAAGTAFCVWRAARAEDERRLAFSLVFSMLIGISTAFMVRDALRGRGRRFRPGRVSLQPLTIQSPSLHNAPALVTIATGADPFQLNAAVEALREEGFDAALLDQEGSSLLGFLGVQMRLVVPNHQAKAAHTFLEAFITPAS